MLVKQANSVSDNASLNTATVLHLPKNLLFPFPSSKANSLRGFHFQHKFQQAKYVNVLKGKILDYVIDLRKNSKTFGKTFKIILSDKNCLSLYIPEGFAHAYFSYEKLNVVYYKLTNYYNPKFEDGIIWNDKKTKDLWPKQRPVVSKKDKNPILSHFIRNFYGI